MPTYTTTPIHTIPASLNALPLDTLRHNGTHYLAVQSGLFEADEIAWKHDDGGRWSGPGPTHIVPVRLSIEGATEEVWSQTGIDTIHRVPSGSELVATWSYDSDWGDGVHWRYLLQDTTSGAIVKSGVLTLQRLEEHARLTLGTIPDGSYLLLAHLDHAPISFQLPPDYTRDNGRYQWGDGLSDYWDYLWNVGKMPPPGHPFYELREELIHKNEQQNRSDWTQYLYPDAFSGGEWSARLVAVGESAFQVSANPAIPASGVSLFEITGTETRTPVFVDPLARTGNVLYRRSDGVLLLAGQRMTPTGIVTALWEKDDDSGKWQLLATNPNPSNFVCECALENHGPTDLLERANGEIYVLTKCSMHRYEPEAESIDERLPGFPQGAASEWGIIEDGSPGGASLREYGGTLYHTTENFSQTTYTASDGTTRAQFYDVLQVTTKSGERTAGPGTRFHGNNNMALWLGKLWAVVQDKPDSDESARQYITYFSGNDWALGTSGLIFNPQRVQWQRLIGTEGCGANVLLVFGKEAQSEAGLIGLGDGAGFTQSAFPYRIRRLTLSPGSSSAPDAPKVLLAIGRESTSEAIDESAWHIVELEIHADDDDERERPTVQEPEECEGGIGILSLRVVPQDGEPIYAIEAMDVGRERILETFNIENAGIWARIDSDASADDEESYIYRVPYARRLVLPVSARRHVDVLFYVPYGCDPLEVNPKVMTRA